MKTIVTGSNGLLGSALKKELGEGHLFLTRKDVELTDYSGVNEFFKDKTKDNGYNTLIHSAALVGGVVANMNATKSFFDKNVDIDHNVLRNCYKNDYDNVVTILSTCIFPDKATYPLTIDQLDNGRPHDSNYGYAYAKRLLAYQTKMYREVTNKNWISIVPTNLFGMGDNFNLEKSHIIPALIRKAHEANINNTDFIIWGDGSPLRQFVFSEDMAKIILWAIDNWKSGVPMIAVDEKEYSIKEIAHIIAERFNISNDRIKFDTSKPNGQHRKPAKSDLVDFKFTPIEDGINKTVDWYLNNQETIRR
jgi:GDP-L-fucose synthase